MNFIEATLSQLYCIAFDDPFATQLDRQLAVQEISRRVKRKGKPYRNERIKIKKVYPK